MSAQGDPSKHSSRSARWRNRLLALLGAAAVLIAVWLTEVPQERVADWGLEQFFGTGVQIEYGGAIGALRIQSLKLFSSADESGLPVVELTDLAIDYELFPDDGRRISEVSIGKLTLRLDAQDPAHPNFAFVEPLLASEGEPPPASIVPRRIRIENIDLVAVGKPPGAIGGQPFDTAGLNISGLNAAVELNEGRVTRALVQGENTFAHTWTGKRTPAGDGTRGRVDVAFVGDANASRFESLMVDLPGLIEIRGGAVFDASESGRTVQAHFETAKLFGDSVSSEQMPIAFGAIDASGATIDSRQTTNIPLSVQSLRIGPVDGPLYDGNLTLAVTRQPERDFEIAATLSDGQMFDARIDPWAGSVLAAIDAWTPEMLNNATPPIYRERLAELPDFDTFSLTVAANAPDAHAWLDGSLATLPFDFSVFGGAALPHDAKEDGLRIEAAGSGAWSEAGLESAHAQGGVVIAGERAAFDIDSGDEKAFASDVRLDNVRISRWLKLAFGDIPVGSESGVLNGTIAYDGETGSAELSLTRGDETASLTASIDGSVGGESVRVSVKAESGGTAELKYDASGEKTNGTLAFADFDLGRLARLVAFEADLQGTGTGTVSFERGADEAAGDLTARLDGVRSEDWSLNPDAPIDLALAFEADAALENVRGKAGSIALGGTPIFTLERWQWTREPFLFEGDVKAELDLAKHGAAIGIEGWGGHASAAFTIAHKDDRWRAPVRVEWTDPRIPGFEDFYAGPIAFQGDLARQPGSSATSVSNGAVTWGEHTKVALPKAAVETSPFGVLGEVSVESDMTVLVALGLFQYIDAAMTAKGEVRLVDGDPQFDLAIDAGIASFELPDGMGAATGAKLAGRVTYDGAYGGSGTLSAADATSAGVVVTQIAGGYEFIGDRLTLNDVTGKLYGGDVLGHGQVELLTGTYNNEFQAGLTRLDLDRFTKEFQPGEFRLTGIADGDVYVRSSTEGLSGARFVLTSTENFTLDRETVETLLTTSAIPDRWGMRWIRNRINKKMVGDDPQRPFDSARVDLTLQQAEGEPDRLLGPITLKSETLDMNIEWAVDVDAIYAAMESDLSAVENISTGAVQSDNQ